MAANTPKQRTVATANKPKRTWVYAKKPAGKLYNYRQLFGYTLLAFLFAAPFIKVNGEPFLLFNILDRKFVIFGSVFWPQDLHILVFGMLIVMVCVVLFTVVYGRVWCGWACPQTIFMELVFRRVEYFIEGDWLQQKKLNASNSTVPNKTLKKVLKHAIFLVISFLISNVFLAYIIGVDALWQIATDPVSDHLGGFVAIVLFTLVFYSVFAYVREIVCTTICPYGRLQGVLMDDKSITIAYDHRRGEPRGKRRKDAEQTPLGDCVDCNLCVQVCPTGIDIRKGLQMECVACTACIDACDAVMEKIDRPKRLIGFYSTDEVEGRAVVGANVRSIAYTVVLVALIGVFGWLVLSRSELDGRLLRAKGSTYVIRDDGTVTNLYTLVLINKSNGEMEFELEPEHPDLDIQVVNNITRLEKGGRAEMSFFLLAPSGAMEDYKTDVTVNILSDGRKVESMKTTFISPVDYSGR